MLPISGSNTGIVAGFRQTSLGNDQLKWEESRSVNGGFDLGLWNGAGNEFNGQAQLKFHYVNVGGVEHTYVEGNVNTNNAADFQIDLVGHIALAASDFIGVV